MQINTISKILYLCINICRIFYENDNDSTKATTYLRNVLKGKLERLVNILEYLHACTRTNFVYIDFLVSSINATCNGTRKSTLATRSFSTCSAWRSRIRFSGSHLSGTRSYSMEAHCLHSMSNVYCVYTCVRECVPANPQLCRKRISKKKYFRYERVMCAKKKKMYKVNREEEWKETRVSFIEPTSLPIDDPFPFFSFFLIFFSFFLFFTTPKYIRAKA